MLRRIFSFIARPDNIGVGVANLALERQYGPPTVSYSPAYLVRGQLARLSPAIMHTTNAVPTVSIQGNGINLQGQYALIGLSQKSGS